MPKGEQKMRKTVGLSLLGMCLLALVSVAAFGEDYHNKGIITINGGNQAVYMGKPGPITPHKRPSGTFYNNFSSSSSSLYTANEGWAISDGTVLGEEFTQGNSFVSTKTGTTHSIIAALSLAGGTGENYVELRKDCKGVPCGPATGDWKKGLGCHVLVPVTQTFGDCCAVVKAKCVQKLTKGKTYWVVMESKSKDNTFTVWNWSNAANADGPDDYNLNDGGWTSNGSSNPQGALSIQ
jgi:hypothetical protein